MAYSALYKDFSGDKQGFFSSVTTADGAWARAKEKDYRFLAKNRVLIEQEFNQLFASLRKQDTDRKEFWLYCYYCSMMLQNYYTAYDKRDKAEEYRRLSKKLRFRCKQGKFEDEDVDERTWLAQLQDGLAADLGVLASTPRHIAKVRDWIAFTNMQRIHFLFCKLTVRQSLLLANELHWIEKLDQFLGTHTDVNGMVSNINATAKVFNLLSVGVFAARFIVNAGLLIKHTFMPTDEERLLSTQARFYQELYLRHCVMLNDLAWGSVNLLTNYAYLFNVSASLANGLTIGFLCFDAALLLYRRQLAKNEYLCKKAQYLSEKRNYETLMSAASISAEEMKRYQLHCKILDEQLEELERNWQVTSSTYLFNVAAAGLLMAGFSASLVLASAAAPLCFLVCTIAVAMYLSADIYGKYRDKSLILQQQELEDRDTTIALLEMQAARNDFIISMAKNIIMPFLIVTVFAVCWEAALVLTAVYVGYECMKGYFNKQPAVPALSKKIETPLLESNNDEDIVEDDERRLVCVPG